MKSFSFPPSQILKLIAESFQEGGKDLYTLGIEMRENGYIRAGIRLCRLRLKGPAELF